MAELGANTGAVWRLLPVGGVEPVLLDRAPSGPLQVISSLAFTGLERRTLCLGRLLGDQLMLSDGPVAGADTVPWAADLGPLEAYRLEAGA